MSHGFRIFTALVLSLCAFIATAGQHAQSAPLFGIHDSPNCTVATVHQTTFNFDKFSQMFEKDSPQVIYANLIAIENNTSDTSKGQKHNEAIKCKNEEPPGCNDWLNTFTNSTRFGTNTPRRLISANKCACQGVVPEYHLVLSVNSPPLLRLSLTPERLISTQGQWSAKIAQPLSRLASGTESNRLYSHHHNRIR